MIDYLNEVTHSVLFCKRTGLEFNIVIEDTGSVSHLDKSLPTVDVQLPTGNVIVTIDKHPKVITGELPLQYISQFNDCLRYISNTCGILLKYYNHCEEYSTFDMFTDLNKLSYYKL